MKKRSTLISKVKHVAQKLGDTVRGQDQFGSSITLNFKGEDSFKTLPGGFISLLLSLCFVSYLFLKLKLMVNSEEWKL